MTRPPPSTRAAYRFFHPISTRWMDNDVFGHVNNVTYYSFIDTAVNTYLLSRRLLEIDSSPVVGVAVESGCVYRSPIAYPDRVTVGVRVGRLGTSSVRYEVGVFRNAEDTVSAEGHFVHVYVDRSTMRPVPMPDTVRQALREIAADAEGAADTEGEK
ncbi:MAG: acyl-CoA thioesterase [Acidisphaera sp.]|nr:acyl-CoA thioesterase [Acidisphaera sp.]